MTNCGYCGKELESWDEENVGGVIACRSCAQIYAEVPCQRCGVYLPQTELKMFNSRLYCNYCIQEIEFEEKEKKEREEKDRKEKMKKSEQHKEERQVIDTRTRDSYVGESLRYDDNERYFNKDEEMKGSSIFGSAMKVVRNRSSKQLDRESVLTVERRRDKEKRKDQPENCRSCKKKLHYLEKRFCNGYCFSCLYKSGKK